MKAAPFFFRIIHQIRTEWRRGHGLFLGWLAVVGVRHWKTIAFPDFGIGPWLEVALVLTAGALVCRCVSADAPANTDTFSLTRPIGQAALWFGKLLFLASALLVPVLAMEWLSWSGFGLGPEQWISMTGAVVLSCGLLGAAAAALTALAATQRQVTGLAVLTVVGLGFWLAIQGILPQPTASLEARNLAICGSLAGGLCAFIGIMTAWWLLTVPRMREIGAGLVMGTLVAAPLVAGAWRIDWVTPPLLTYPNSARLTVKTGNADPADSMLGLALWPTLHIGGLGQDEVASIVEFSPVEDGKPWPPETSYTDLDRDGYSDDWLHSDHTRALFKHYPKATLWREEIRNQGLRFGRRTLEEVLQAHRLKREEAIARPWRLRLVVHEMNRVATVPFRHLWTRDHDFLIRPGLRFECRAINFEGGSYLMRGCAHRVSSAVLPIERHRPVHVRDRDLSAGLFLVLEDGELRENLAGAMSFWPISHPRGVLDQWQVEESRGTCLNPKLPRGQEAILQRTLDQWIDSQNASFWHAQERGIVDFDLTPEQMAEVIPKPQEKGRK